MKSILSKIMIGLTTLFYHIVYVAVRYLPTIKLYQPVVGGASPKGLTRSCEDRWEAFSVYLPKEKGSVLDIGCNIGYFSFKSAEEGHFAYGVEYHRSNILICYAIKNVTSAQNTTFIRHFIDIDYLKTMPRFDTVINLSVFHHWVKGYGFDHAKEMMQVLADKCDCLVFETGQSDEQGSQWPEILKFMGDNPEAWIKSFLKEIGFKKITNVGTFSTGLTETKRVVFVAKK